MSNYCSFDKGVGDASVASKRRYPRRELMNAFSISPELGVAVSMLFALTLYALFGGAEFGAGVWHLLARGPRAEAQHQLISHPIRPVWEANHVWLIIVIVLLFTGFPPAFAV